MNKNSFYVELQSNSKCYVNNTVANFRNRICLNGELRGKWEVALVEISYTYSWKNLPSSQFVSMNKNTKKPTKVRNFLETIKKIKAGYYESTTHLIEEIDRKIKEFKKGDYLTLPDFHIDNINKLLYIKPGLHKDGSLLFPEFSSELSEILGFEDYSTDKLKINSNYIVSIRPPDLNVGLHTLFVYSDIVEPQYIGDTQAKLLKTVEVPNDIKFGDQVLIKYSNPHYVPILFNDFETIEIDIKNDINERIPFLFGRTRAKLHFRRYD